MAGGTAVVPRRHRPSQRPPNRHLPAPPGAPARPPRARVPTSALSPLGRVVGFGERGARGAAAAAAGSGAREGARPLAGHNSSGAQAVDSRRLKAPRRPKVTGLPRASSGARAERSFFAVPACMHLYCRRQQPLSSFNADFRRSPTTTKPLCGTPLDWMAIADNIVAAEKRPIFCFLQIFLT